MHFEIVGEITNVQNIAAGRRIRQFERLRRLYGKGRWRKMKGEALIRLLPARYDMRSCTGTKHTVSARGT